MTPVEERIDREAKLRKEWRGLRADLLAVRGHLTTPYPDDDRWTPWDRFVGPGIERMQRALDALLTEHSRYRAALQLLIDGKATVEGVRAALPATEPVQPEEERRG